MNLKIIIEIIIGINGNLMKNIILIIFYIDSLKAVLVLY
jgi:hypothetical protein